MILPKSLAADPPQYLMYASSANAAATIARSACAAAAPLFDTYMFDALGVGGGGSLVAGVACLLAPMPFIFYKYGWYIRERSRFAVAEKNPSTSPSQPSPTAPLHEASDQASVGLDEEKQKM